MNKHAPSSLSFFKPLVLAAAVSALAACGGGNNNGSDGGNSSSVTQSSSSQAQSSTPASSSSVSSIASSSSSSVTPPDPVAVFSDDFESANLGSIWGEAGDVQLTSERAASGSRSVKFVADDGKYNRNYITLDLNGTEVQDEMYGRMMIWVDRPDQGNGGDFTFIQAEGFPKPSVGAPSDTMVMYRYRVDGRDRNGTVLGNYDTWVDSNNDGQTEWLTDCWDHSNTQLPRETWSCVEWYFDSATNEMQFWLNGNEISEIHMQSMGEGCIDNRQQGIWEAPAKFDRVHVGIEQYHNGVEARTVYVDDVVVDTRKVGCPSN